MPSDAYHTLALKSATLAHYRAVHEGTGTHEQYRLVLKAIDAGDIIPVEIGTSYRELGAHNRQWIRNLLEDASFDGLPQHMPGDVRVAYRQLIKQLELLNSLQHPRLRLTLGQLKITLPQLRQLGEPLGLSHLVDDADLAVGSWHHKKSA